MSLEVISFGCRMNLAEGEAIRAALASETALTVINSCAVTAEAERQARQAIRKAARERPGGRIVVTGCASAAHRACYEAMPQVSAVRDKAELLPPARPPVSGASHARAFIGIQDGCDHDCTFCITTIARGSSRSISAAAIVGAIHAALERGQQEVVLTGIDLTGWGRDLPGEPRLGDLVAAILRDAPALPRLRLSSLDCSEIDPLLEELLTGEARMMPHVHLSLQHGDDLILKRMKRRHSRADAVGLVERLKVKRPEIAISADLIAGFPTEGEAAFANSLGLIEACSLSFAHVFPYSPRPGTAAARMPQLDRTLVTERAQLLRARAMDAKHDWLASMIHTRQPALIELDGQTGHLDNFARVRLEAPIMNGNRRGTMIDVKVMGRDGDVLVARASA